MERVELCMGVEFALDPDTALMVRVSKGHIASFSFLLERHRSAVVSHLHRLVRNYDIAEELAQDVFIRIYRSRAKYRPNAKFTTWLFRITTNIALNWRREAGCLRLDAEIRGAQKPQISDRRPLAEELLIRAQHARQIRAAIQTLPPKQLAAVLLHKYEGLEYAQIAEVLGCSLPALKSLLFRAYETLRRRLAHLDPAPAAAEATRTTAAAL